MFEHDGYVYASEPAKGMKVRSARVVDDLCMLVTFSTGEVRLLDATELLCYEAFAPLADRDLFRAFAIERGVLTWADGEIDIAPEGLYRRTYEYLPAVAAV